MAVKILKSKAVPDTQSLLAVEQALGFKLPQHYLSFVSQYNGGEPQTNTFPIGSSGNDSGINEFIPLQSVIEEFEIGGFNAISGFFPFAFAEGGNYVCIEAKTGKVFFWDHEFEPSSQEGLMKLAESVPQFLELLTPFSSSQIKLKPGQVKSAWIDPSLLNDVED